MTDRLTCRRTLHPDQAGFGLIEVMAAVVVTSVGVLAAASGAFGIYAESNRSREDTDRALAARSALERSTLTPFASIASSQTATSYGGRQYVVTQTVGSLGSRLKRVQITVDSPLGRPLATFETRVSAPRPLPVAP